MLTEVPCPWLSANRPPRDYRGGPMITAFRGDTPTADDDRTPEDWVASTTTLFGDASVGLTTLAGGGSVRDLVAADPQAVLGEKHLAVFGTDTGLLVKLLNPEQRLPVHVHPDRAHAKTHLGCTHGKTEAWIVLATRGASASVYLGFDREVTAGELAGWVAAQRSEDLLAPLREIDVRAGDVVLVPGGTAHAIGPGVLLIELQEPTDLSILLEHDAFGRSAEDAFLGMDVDTALAAVDRTRLDDARLAALRTREPDGPGAHDMMPAGAAPFFRAHRLDASAGPVTAERSFGALIVTAGSGQLLVDDAPPQSVNAGDVLLTTYAVGPVTLVGDVRALHCLPPSPGRTTG
jgi:mannose-6-phosphate isomerase